MEAFWKVGLVAILSLVFGVGAFWNAEISLIQNLTTALVAIAAVIFAILGVWITALNPLKVFHGDETITDSERDLIEELEPFFKRAILAFAAVVILKLLVFVVPPTADSTATLIDKIIELLNDRGSERETFAFPQIFDTIAKIITGIFIVFLFLVEAVLVLINLKPLFEAEEERRKKAIEDSKRSRRHQVL